MKDTSTTPVVAVIPHFNMPQTLTPLLEQATQQDYDGVYVLDDNSTNCNIREIAAPFGKAVNLIAGTENRGAGGNRNRILEADAKILGGSILHFIDADCELLGGNISDKARALFDDPSIGAVGGLVLNTDWTQYPFNYGPRMSWLFGLSVRLQNVAAREVTHRPYLAKTVRRLASSVLEDWPDVTLPPKEADAFYLAEANFLIPYDVFSTVGGFDAQFRFGEAQDLAHKLSAANLRRRFDPTIVVMHHAVQVAGKKRKREELLGTLHLAKKYGLPFK